MTTIAAGAPEYGDIDLGGVRMVTMPSLAPEVAMLVLAADGSPRQVCLRDAAAVARFEAGETFSLHAVCGETWRELEKLGRHALPTIASMRIKT